MPSGFGCCLPASLPLGREAPIGQPACPLVFSRSFENTRVTVGCYSLYRQGLFFSLSLAIPWFGLLSHISSLRLSSGHSGPVPTLRTGVQPRPPCPARTRWRQTRASMPFLWLCLYLWLGAFSVGFFFFSQLCCPLRFQNSPQTCLWEGFILAGSFSFMPPPQDGSPCLNLPSLLLSFIFCLTSFGRDWAAFLGACCPLPAFRSCSVGVLNIQMIC